MTFCLHPGAVRTELLRYSGEGVFRWFPYILMLAYPIWLVTTKTPEEGAQTTIYCAVEDNLEKFNGYYFE
jgi:hypothetical protein